MSKGHIKMQMSFCNFTPWQLVTEGNKRTPALKPERLCRRSLIQTIIGRINTSRASISNNKVQKSRWPLSSLWPTWPWTTAPPLSPRRSIPQAIRASTAGHHMPWDEYLRSPNDRQRRTRLLLFFQVVSLTLFFSNDRSLANYSGVNFTDRCRCWHRYIAAALWEPQ